ncbi:MAG: hypothetical protein AB7M05_20300 [Alphaproteobacteria bacterium]
MKYLLYRVRLNSLPLLGFLSRDSGHSALQAESAKLHTVNKRDCVVAQCRILLVATTLLLSSCVSQNFENVGSDPEVQKTWNDAYVSLPNGTLGYMKSPRVQAALAASQSFPVVIFFHGCAGLSGNSVNAFAESMNAAGYIFIAPDSMARDFRPQGCAGGNFSYTAKGIDWDTINRMRMEEIYYTISQVRSAPWFKSNDLFLFGQSEGGLAVAAYSGSGVNAEVISGWGCPSYTLANRDSTLIDRPVKAPPSVPVLNIKSKMDHVDTRPSDCGSSVWGRPGGSKVINPPNGHWFMDDAKYRQEVINFFDRNRHPDSSEPAKESNK